MNKTVEGLKKAKQQGYKYVASVVKSVYTTTYYHVVLIDDVIAAGKWIPAQKVSMMPWHGRIGQNYLPAKTVLKSKIYN